MRWYDAVYFGIPNSFTKIFISSSIKRINKTHSSLEKYFMGTSIYEFLVKGWMDGLSLKNKTNMISKLVSNLIYLNYELNYLFYWILIEGSISLLPDNQTLTATDKILNVPAESGQIWDSFSSLLPSPMQRRNRNFCRIQILTVSLRS